MPNDERILNVLQQTLTEIQRMNTRLAKIETELADVDQHHATLDHYLQELELVTENNNVMSPAKNFSPLPNEVFYLDLSYGAIAVYGYLIHIEDRKTFQSYAGYNTIGRAV